MNCDFSDENYNCNLKCIFFFKSSKFAVLVCRAEQFGQNFVIIKQYNYKILLLVVVVVAEVVVILH